MLSKWECYIIFVLVGVMLLMEEYVIVCVVWSVENIVINLIDKLLVRYVVIGKIFFFRRKSILIWII